ncbi:MAG TPA: hypothetical protein VM509_08825, partial [Planctomycetota bacterium]|nr:hypothetical protein [Planctomycetota bacterium]
GGEITIVLRDDVEGDLVDIVRHSEFDDETIDGTGLVLAPRASNESEPDAPMAATETVEPDPE